MAILLNLPYESLHRNKVRKTLKAVTNWLGSPQSALTATLWNVRQIRWCHRRSKEGDLNSDLNDAYYMLSCLNQFELGVNLDKEFFRTLVYGLFRPSYSGLMPRQSGLEEERRLEEEVVLTKQLLSDIAFQLRMLRRRSVIPTLASLGTFLVAFIFSVVLAFGNIGDQTSFLALSVGLLVMWLPLLVIFTIVDRNPVSSERSA
jgi:hypothetical protein